MIGTGDDVHGAGPSSAEMGRCLGLFSSSFGIRCSSSGALTLCLSLSNRARSSRLTSSNISSSGAIRMVSMLFAFSCDFLE